MGQDRLARFLLAGCSIALLSGRPTGCTVVLTDAGATAGVDVRGTAPATRETDLLNPVDIVQQIHAIVLSGGSAFGLDSATGVMKYLEEKGIGFPFGGAHVPTVPAASLFDLAVGDPKIRPTADCGYQAARRRRAGRSPKAISPSHTPNDGDVIFAIATGARTGDASVGTIGALAAEVMADAILRAVRQATGVPGYPAIRDLKDP